jgi:hypothetical protein
MAAIKSEGGRLARCYRHLFRLLREEGTAGNGCQASPAGPAEITAGRKDRRLTHFTAKAASAQAPVAGPGGEQ